MHPLTAARGVSTLDRAGPLVAPTLSVRTVAVLDEPGTHLKLPMPTATLGSRNSLDHLSRAPSPTATPCTGCSRRCSTASRSWPPPWCWPTQSSWVDSDDELLAALVRRYPADVADDERRRSPRLLAPDPYGRAPRVLDRLAEGVDWFDPVP